MNSVSAEDFETMLRQSLGEAGGNAPSMASIVEAVPSVNALGDLERGSTVIVRADLDSPIVNGKVDDRSRILSCLDTINYGRERGWKVVLLAHLGRSGASLAPVRDALEEELGAAVTFISDWYDEEQNRLADHAVEGTKSTAPGEVILFENIRRYSIEQALWKASAEDVGSIAAVMRILAEDFANRISPFYINEAIAASNPDFSSAALPLVMERVALGSFVANELKYLTAVQEADAVFMSGLKANKLDDLEGMLSRGTVKLVMIAGAVAMSLKKAEARLSGSDFSIGLAEIDSTLPSFISADRLEQAERIVAECRSNEIELVLPIDFKLDDGSLSPTIPAERQAMDIGPESVTRFREALTAFTSDGSGQANGSHILFYNGVPGKFEDPEFAEGTIGIVRVISSFDPDRLQVYVGGGEGRLAVKKYGDLHAVTHAFTAGGTVLKAISGRPLPFLDSLKLAVQHSTADEE